MRKRGKKGQFYLIATIILIIILFGFITISNYVKKENYKKIYYLGEELKIESAEILEYGLSNPDKIDYFMSNFSTYAGEEVEIIYLIENDAGDINVYKYLNGERITEETVTENEGKISFTFNEVVYEFETNVGKDFHFIMAQGINGEKYVVTN